MFLERPKKDITAILPYLKQHHIEYEMSDCTLPGEEVEMTHLQFTRELSPDEIRRINDMLDNLYGKDTTSRIQTNDVDGNGRADYIDAELEKEEKQNDKPIHREWDQKMHTPMQEAKGWFMGENER